MRKNLIIALSLTVASIANAQFRPNNDRSENRTETDQKKFSFGYFLGTNMMNYKIVPKARAPQTPDHDGVNEHGLVYLDQESKAGFSVGLIAKMRVNDYIDLKSEPGLHFGQRILYFNNIKDPNTGKTLDDPSKVMREVKSTYVEIPLLLNFHGDRWYNTRPYIQGGLGYLMNLQSNEKKEDDNATGVFRTTTNNFNWQAEIGVEIYFKRFKLTPALKGMFFFNNEIVPDNSTIDDPRNPGSQITVPYWTGSLNSLSTRAFVFSLKFE
ncbi:type IX secretion/gliding motility protein PorT/SprT [Empedobacter stercoris]|uniref:PorT family protein n=1 Tax=Empedobacter stercoris TaxID=1628248 RepID=A0ABX1WKP8_9FLAO|nr:porin family protein [Empedobacter stercoris]NOJ75122.1 PorT family protein [Empedobacter stercoris]